MRIGLLLNVLVWAVSLSAQNKSIKGYLLNNATGQPLIYASVQLKHALLGTISNAEGAFYLRLPPNAEHDTVVFSFVGYETIQIALQDFPESDTIILLHEKTVEIGEIFVRAIHAKDIVQKCVDAFQTQFMQTPMMLKAYFREIINDNGRMEKFTEAQISIAKQAYSSNKKDAMQFLDGKYHETQSISPLWEYLDFINGPYEALHCDAAKYKNDFMLIPSNVLSFLNPRHFKYYQYKIRGENADEYLIEFSPKSKRAVYRGQLIIKRSDYALLAYYYTIDNEKLNKVSLLQYETQEYLYNLDIQAHSTDYYAYGIYREVNGQYILHHAGLSYESLFHSSSKNFLSLIRVSNQLVITEYTETETAEIPLFKRISHHIPVYEQIQRLNNPQFQSMQIIVPEQNIYRFLQSAAK